MELPGIEPDALPGNITSDLQVHSVSFRFNPARNLRFCFRVLTASPARPGTADATVLTVCPECNSPAYLLNEHSVVLNRPPPRGHIF
jgi:hypothetical protein